MHSRRSGIPMTGFRILFVCVGNVCRSPLGERLLAARLPADRFEVSSAGVGALAGAAMDPEAAATSRRTARQRTGSSPGS